jgi:flotillin
MAGVESLIWVAGGIAALVVVLTLAVSIYSRRYKRVAPDEALVVFGRKGSDGRGVEIVLGGGRFIWPVFEDVRTIKLSTRQIPVQVPEVITKQGVALQVHGIAQVKVKSDPASLATAAEQLLDKTPEQIGQMSQKILIGHIRTACAKMEIEDINSDRQKLGKLIQEEAVPELEKLGLEMTVFTIEDIQDTVGYLRALGEKRTAEVKRDAQIGKAEAEREGAIKVAQAKRDQESATSEALDRDLKIKRIQAQQAGLSEEAARQADIASSEKNRDVKKQQFAAEVQKEKAQADIAYQLQQTKAQQDLADIDAELKQRLAIVRERDETLTRVIPARKAAEALAAQAEGEKQKIIITADARASEVTRLAEGEADRIRLLATAESERVQKVGAAAAEAEGLMLTARAAGARKMAEALAEPALLELEKYKLLAPQLPAIAEALGKSLQGTEKVFVMGGPQDFVSGVVGIGALLPELVRTVTGSTVLENVNNASRAVQGKLDAEAGGGAAGLGETAAKLGARLDATDNDDQ